MLLGILRPAIAVLIVTLLLSLMLSKRLAKNIISPLEKIDPDIQEKENVYEELLPFLSRIETQRRKILQQKQNLANRQQEFQTVIENMAEGLALLNPETKVLCINPAAAEFFHTDASAVGKDMIELDRSAEIDAVIRQAALGKKQSVSIRRNDRDYTLSVNPVLSGSRLYGLVLFIIDATEKMSAERQRREFTANVSHELKTPLQSIMGSAELLENNLVQKEDIPRFVGHIREEASRLVSLINDILHLARLDEQAEVPCETVDLYELAEQVQKNLLPLAQCRQVSLSVEGCRAVMTGSQQLLYEIIYNLCDNALKYNKANGSVRVRITDDKTCTRLTVTDTGIGIAPEYREKIFERFYRIDKSRSRKTGGTGLGLSIVKHAVQYMNGRISLDSREGEGTTIEAIFPKKNRLPYLMIWQPVFHIPYSALCR